MKRRTWFTLCTIAVALVLAACSQTATVPTPTPEFEAAEQNETEILAPAAHVEIPTGGVDLTHLGTTVPLVGAVVQQSNFDGSTGTGVFESFVRLNTNAATSQGFNTSGRPTLFDEMASSNFTRDLPLSAVPLQPVDEGDPAIYREFRADVNQTSGGSLLSLDAIRVIISKTAGAVPADPSVVAGFGTCAALVWEMEAAAWIALDYALAPGSGNGDMRLLIEDALFTTAMATCDESGAWYVYLYSEFGGQGGVWGQDDGFEEWSVRKAVTSAVADKNVNFEYDRTYAWTIDKDVAPDELHLFLGDTAEAAYTVTVDADYEDTNFSIYGEAFLINGGADLRVTGWADQVGIVDETDVDGPMDVLSNVTLVCDTTVLVNPGGNTLPTGTTLECTYTFDFASDPRSGLEAGEILANRVTFTTGQGSNDVDVTYTEVFTITDPTTVNDEVVEVEDTFDGGAVESLGTVDASTADLPFDFEYDRTFSCSATGTTDYDNTAEIVETGQTADATVTVDCYDLDVAKDADASFAWDWTIDKVEDNGETDLRLAEGQLFELEYTVTVAGTAVDFAVAGTITVTNDAPIDAVLTAVADLVSPDIAATVDCGTAVFPYTLAKDGGELECTYAVDLPNADGRTNTATATQRNHDYDADGVATESGTTDHEGTAAVAFGLGDLNCVEVWDDKTDPTTPVLLGHACAAVDASNPVGATLLDSSGEAEFGYSLFVGTGADADVPLVCDDRTTLTNVATVNDLGDGQTPGDELDRADWTVDALAECPTGCTLTQGYWKTHNASFWGGAPDDDTWLLIVPHAEQTDFFYSGTTYFDAMWTSPAGNPYWNLATQYIAAELNLLNGASMPAEVQTAFDAATAWLDDASHTPASTANLKGKNGNELRQLLTGWASILDAYNNGLYPGYPHCSEDANSG